MWKQSGVLLRNCCPYSGLCTCDAVYANKVTTHTFCAAAMATLASPAFISGTVAITSPLAGFFTSNDLPEAAPTHSPLIKAVGPFNNDAIVLDLICILKKYRKDYVKKNLVKMKEVKSFLGVNKVSRDFDFRKKPSPFSRSKKRSRVE